MFNKINGITLAEYLKQDSFNMSEYIGIFIQIIEIYSEMYDKYNFIHYDCYPWNIIIKDGKVYIIDFDKAHIKYRNKHIGNVKVKNNFRYQDILSFMFNTLFLIIKNHYLNKKDIYILYRVIEYFKDTIYFKDMITLKDIKDKCNTYKKFDFMI